MFMSLNGYLVFMLKSCLHLKQNNKCFNLVMSRFICLLMVINECDLSQCCFGVQADIYAYVDLMLYINISAVISLCAAR